MDIVHSQGHSLTPSKLVPEAGGSGDRGGCHTGRRYERRERIPRSLRPCVQLLIPVRAYSPLAHWHLESYLLTRNGLI
jgi:hypothetical protein